MFGNRMPWALLVSLVIIAGACGINEESAADTTTVRERTYLMEVVPPCLPTESEPDPCPVDLPTPQNTGSTLLSSRLEIPTFTERLIYDPEKDGLASIHIVIRGTVKTGTTRCEIYKYKLPDHRAEHFQKVGGLSLDDQYIIGRYHYTCFADVAVKEYIVGEGPPTLPIMTRFAVLLESHFNYQGKIKKNHLDFYGDPKTQALAYEGREMIYFLGPPPSITVEAWVGHSRWFLQQTGQGIRAISRSIRRAYTDEMRSKLNLPLDEMIAEIKQAAINRETITGGQIGLGPDMPILITDAHNLRDYYTSVGAIYDDTENTTVLPPPAPGEDDPPDPTLPVNDGTTGTTTTSIVLETTTGVTEPVFEYLEEVVPPCLIDDSGWDPCVAETPHQARAATISATPPSWPYVEGVLSFREILLRYSRSARAHIVVRGIPQIDSTRCAAYPVGIADYKLKTMGLPLSSFENDLHYHCFVDVKINEYIVGKGPPVLPVSMIRENLRKSMLDENKEILYHLVPWRRHPANRVASAYEGKEMILFLTLPASLTVESWLTFGIFDRWFVQRTPAGVRAIAQDIELAINDQQRNRLNRPLDQLVQEVKEAAEYRFTVTGGRLDADPTLPFFVTDANRLRDFYISVGAVYDDSERATRPPPPVPEKAIPPPLPSRSTTAPPDHHTGSEGEEPTEPPATVG